MTPCAECGGPGFVGLNGRTLCERHYVRALRDIRRLLDRVRDGMRL
jgi:hypothetical protein